MEEYFECDINVFFGMIKKVICWLIIDGKVKFILVFVGLSLINIGV